MELPLPPLGALRRASLTDPAGFVAAALTATGDPDAQLTGFTFPHDSIRE